MYKQNLPIQLNGHPFHALVDSGNTFRSAISKEAYLKVGGRLSDLKAPAVKKIGTASSSAKLTVMGELPSPLLLQVGEVDTIFRFNPVVIDGLAMDVNISGPFLKSQKWDHLHSQDALNIQGRRVPLVSAIRQPEERRIHFSTPTTVPAACIAVVNLKAEAPTNGKSPSAGDFLLRGDYSFTAEHGLHPAINALVRVDSNGLAKACLINSQEQPVTVEAGTLYGSICPVTVLSPEERRQVAFADSIPEPVLATGDDSIYAMPSPLLGGNKRQRDRAYLQEYMTKVQSPNSSSNSKGARMPATEAEKREWIVDQFKLRENKLLSQEGDFQRAVDLLLKHIDGFSIDGNYGMTQLLEHRIITPADALPVKDKYRPLNPALEPDFKKTLDEWLDQGIVEPADSPWSANLVVVKKKDGRLRYCVDW